MTLTELQQQLAAQKLDACIITRNNQFLGQDILPEENRLQRLTGFSGSAGNLLVFATVLFFSPTADTNFRLPAKPIPNRSKSS